LTSVFENQTELDSFEFRSVGHLQQLVLNAKFKSDSYIMISDMIKYI